MAEASIVWFRNDLRVADNPALKAALDRRNPVTALYVHEADSALRQRGAASRWWLHQSLDSLAETLAGLGVRLAVETGHSQETVLAAARAHTATAVFWNRRYGPAERGIDAAIKRALGTRLIEAQSCNGHLLVEPWDIATGEGKPYSVFTPFWRAVKRRDMARPSPRPAGHTAAAKPLPVDAGYAVPRWANKLAPHWTIGEAGALAALQDFLDGGIERYSSARDFPGRDATSRLSPHLAFGEISARQVWHAATALAHRGEDVAERVDKFLSELAWREFNYHQLYHREDIASVPMQPKFAAMPWRRADADLNAWQHGRTGLPIVDAGMRELWQTGFMHNRVRMVTASLLAKNLLLDWRLGEQWFFDCLVDADPANNAGNWQWVAGCGLDASPYFRIFNPVTQGERFDADGAYVRRFVPELAALPDAFVHRPFDAPDDLLKSAGIELGNTYPAPIVALKPSRERALAVLREL